MCAKLIKIRRGSFRMARERKNLTAAELSRLEKFNQIKTTLEEKVDKGRNLTGGSCYR